jgi:4-hydroxybenzoate polyprenyltransferase
LKSYLSLTRPANLVTAIADILAGIAIAKYGISFDLNKMEWLLLIISTLGLYGGGVVFNDVFDAELDAIERPERAIPSGKISKQNAAIFGAILLFFGVSFAFLASNLSGIIAIIISILAVFYDKFGKHHSIIGPINMGLCRGGNLILGISINPEAINKWWWLGIVPVIYIAAITMISRNEVHGGKKQQLYYAGMFYILVSILQLLVSYQFGNVLFILPFLVLHLIFIFKPLSIAIKKPIGQNIGKSVKAGVLGLIIMDAAWVSLSGNFLLALIVLLLLPLSILLAKSFAVT